MKITNYSVNAQSEHLLEKISFSAERLDIWAGQGPALTAQEEESSFIVELGSAGAKHQFVSSSSSAAGTQGEGGSAVNELDIKIRLIESLVYALTGKRIRLNTPSLDIKNLRMERGGVSSFSFAGAAPDAGVGWGIAYDKFESYSETEQIRYTSSGSVQTADGRNISFHMDFSMSRSYYEANSLSIRLGDAARMDPLVIAYAGTGPRLSKEKYGFDLNGDGKNENISFATGGSGFLALDKNGDGKINDGTELFGTQSGNGFADLRAYDVDKNGWIDESDPVFSMLSVFTIGADGERTLFSLGEAGVGAIYLNETATQFAFTDGRTSDGMMQSSSVFLRENGTAGTIHHIDLTI